MKEFGEKIRIKDIEHNKNTEWIEKEKTPSEAIEEMVFKYCYTNIS